MSDHLLTTVEQLEAHYGQPAGSAVWKEIDHINAQYRAFIEAAPFFVLASVGPEGVDASRLTTKGWGETKPRVPNDTDANRQKNRRLEAIVEKV